jgi:hypothetical protein
MIILRTFRRDGKAQHEIKYRSQVFKTPVILIALTMHSSLEGKRNRGDTLSPGRVDISARKFCTKGYEMSAALILLTVAPAVAAVTVAVYFWRHTRRS